MRTGMEINAEGLPPFVWQGAPVIAASKSTRTYPKLGRKKEQLLIAELGVRHHGKLQIFVSIRQLPA